MKRLLALFKPTSKNREPHDFFRPTEPFRREIYDAFVEVSRNRDTSSMAWVERERQAVFEASCAAAIKYGLTPPTLDEVRRSESYAKGSADYGRKWACRIAETILSKTNGNENSEPGVLRARPKP